jgi:hypothetical protein
VSDAEYDTSKVEVTFLQFRKPLDDTKFMLFRCVNDVPVGWLTPFGAWVPFPEDEDEAAEMFRKLVDDDDWPVWSAPWMDEDYDGEVEK